MASCHRCISKRPLLLALRLKLETEKPTPNARKAFTQLISLPSELISEVPIKTGAIAAGSVRGRAPAIQVFIFLSLLIYEYLAGFDTVWFANSNFRNLRHN